MKWAMVGWSHHQTPVEVREKLAFSREQVVDALERFRVAFPRSESVLLSTCNRTELYCAASEDDLPAAEQLGQFLTDYHGYPFDEVATHLTKLAGKEAIRHLFTVAASLDSMVIGEAQILSQVKTAYELACESQSVAKQMHRAFQRAATVAKRVTSETAIHRKRVSIPSVAVSEIATEFFERFEDKHVLLIGAGEMGTETLRYLQDHGTKHIRLVNRHRERAEKLAQEFGATVEDFENLDHWVVRSDLVVCTTGATDPVITVAGFNHAREKGNRAVLILDLAVPRDVEVGVGDLAEVYLFTVDDLQEVADQNLAARREEWPKAKHIVDEETEKFVAESKHHGSGTTIKQLRAQAEDIKSEELQRLITKLEARGLDASHQKEIEVAFDRLVNKLLHPPLKSLRDNADSSHHASLILALRRLFQLPE